MVAFKLGGRDWRKYRSPGVGGYAELHLGSGPICLPITFLYIFRNSLYFNANISIVFIVENLGYPLEGSTKLQLKM